MCYKILVIEKHCKRKHIQAAKLCWRQCKTQAALSYRTKNWRQLCDNREHTDVGCETWYPFTPRDADPICDVCLQLELDHEARELRNILDIADEFIKECLHAIEENAHARAKIGDMLTIHGPDINESQRQQILQEFTALSKTERFLRGNIGRKAEQVEEHQKRYDEIEKRYEQIYCDPILDKAVAMLEGRFLIYMGRPDEVELEKLDCPRHLLACDPRFCEMLVC